jgi:secreted trypsin-like serine protease
MSARGILVFVVAMGTAAVATYFILTRPELFSGITERGVEVVSTTPKNTGSANPQAAPATSQPGAETRFLRRADAVCKTKPPERANERILGGGLAHIESWPGFVSLRMSRAAPDGKRDSTYFCAGVLVDKKWVVTAAHCIKAASHSVELVQGKWVEARNHPLWQKGADFEIIEGREDLTKDANERVLLPKSIKVHEQYQGITGGYDIALVELATAATMKPMKLSVSRSADPASSNGTNMYVAGFGKARANQGELDEETTDQKNTARAYTHLLKENYLPLFENDKCGAAVGQTIHDRQICAGHVKRRNEDSCNADSGGPLVRLDSNECPVLVGLVSYGIGCGKEGVPGVYTRVSAFHDWIKQNASGVSLAEVSNAGDMAPLAAIDEAINAAVARSVAGGSASSPVVVKPLPSTQVKLGDLLKVSVSSERAGYVTVIDVNSKGEITFLVPNKFDHEYEPPYIEAGKQVVFGDANANFQFRTVEPVGEGRIVAIVSSDKTLWRRLRDAIAARDPGVLERGIVAEERGSEKASDPDGTVYELGLSGAVGENWALGYVSYRIDR